MAGYYCVQHLGMRVLTAGNGMDGTYYAESALASSIKENGSTLHVLCAEQWPKPRLSVR
jgi:hypothetical protein